MAKEQDLDGNRQARMQHADNQQQHLTRLLVRRANDRIQVLQQEEHADAEAGPDQRVIQRAQRTPADQRDHDPEQVAVAVQRPALDNVEALRAEPAQRGPQPRRHEQRVPVDQARGAAEQAEVVLEVLLALAGQFLADGPREEEDDHDGGGDPQRAVEVGRAVERVEEGRCVGQEG